MTRKPDYECPRCGYCTHHKTFMRKHLMSLKKPCPAARLTIELTDDIKQDILDNRVYHPPAPPANNMYNIVNNINTNNTIANYVNKLEIKDKLTKYLDFKQLELQDFETTLEEKYIAKVNRMERNGYKYGFVLEAQDIMGIIDEISSIKHEDATFEDLNLMFNPKYQKLMIYNNGDWDEHLIDNGISRIIELVKEYFLDTYEIYLIRRIQNSLASLEHLTDYYKFIACFRVQPYIKGLPNNKILYNLSDPRFEEAADFHDISMYTITDEFYPKYQEISNALCRGEISEMKRKVLEIIKRNSSRNIDEFNKRIVDLIRMDDGFKPTIFKNDNRS